MPSEITSSGEGPVPADRPPDGSSASVRTLAGRVRSGEVASDTLVKGAALTIAERNGELNALTSQRSTEAIRDAVQLDVTNRKLAGIPFTVKDVLATADLPTTCGSQALQAWTSEVDATVVARMRAAGAILMGKSNCPEFALGVDTNNDLFGRTRNPLGNWTPGGSSGGESSAIASGMSLVGLGTDYGGSLRWPAQCAGLVGLRPTVGRVSRAGLQPTLPGAGPLDVATDSFHHAVEVLGPIARTVDDIDIVMSVIQGADGIDPLAVDEVIGDYRNIRVRDVEVRWGIQLGEAPVENEVADAVLGAVATLRAHGARVTEGLPPAVADGLGLYDRLRSADGMSEISAVKAAAPDLISEPIRAMLAGRVSLSPSERSELWLERDRLIIRLRGWLRGNRVLLLPVSVDVPRDLGGSVDNFGLLAPSRAISLFGVPALSVPVTIAQSGAPISVQVVAPAFREDIALAVGAVLERG